MGICGRNYFYFLFFFQPCVFYPSISAEETKRCKAENAPQLLLLIDKLLCYTVRCAALQACQGFFVESTAPFQAKNSRFSRGFWVLLCDSCVFYALSPCRVVRLFVMCDTSPFRHFATFPQIFIFWVHLRQFE